MCSSNLHSRCQNLQKKKKKMGNTTKIKQFEEPSSSGLFKTF